MTHPPVDVKILSSNQTRGSWSTEEIFHCT